jgi:hypothetical protein
MAEQKTEYRDFTVSELRARSGSKPGITGHAAVFNQLSDDLGGYREQIQPGAFADTIKSGDVRALWNHDPNFILARTKSGTLRLSEDREGLKIDADFPDTTFARDLLISIERGDVDQMSFGFMVFPDGSNWRMEDGGVVRTLTKVELFDVSPVTFPVYPQTDVGVRAELRSIAQAKLKELSAIVTEPSAEQKAAFEARAKERRKFIEANTPPVDKWSYAEILKRCRIAT